MKDSKTVIEIINILEENSDKKEYRDGIVGLEKVIGCSRTKLKGE